MAWNSVKEFFYKVSTSENFWVVNSKKFKLAKSKFKGQLNESLLSDYTNWYPHTKVLHNLH